ncbi:MAG: hypothetical protein R3A48_29360 [Polyangiales bacterium]
MDMTDKRLADIEAMAHETVLRCSANNDCDAPATWRDPALWREGESPDDWVCDAHVSNRRKAHPIETLELGALALVAEVRELRAIIAGRTTPPTDAEIREHAERGGAWLVTLPPRAQVRMMPETRYTSDPVEVSRLWWSEGAWWVPVRYGRPCSWPTTEVPRG